MVCGFLLFAVGAAAFCVVVGDRRDAIGGM